MKKLNQILAEATAHLREEDDPEIAAHDERFNRKVVGGHMKHIEKKYGKDSVLNFGSGGDDESGTFTSKVDKPGHGRVHVTTHYDPKTHKVLKHVED